MPWNKAVFCLEVLICKHLQKWRHNDVIGRNEYVISTWSFTAIFVYIYTSLIEIWKKMWVGVFSEHSVCI